MDKYAILIDELIVKLINHAVSTAKLPRNYGTDEKILLSYIHMIEFIGANPDHNTTELAEIVGLTKGTTSKRLARLEKEEYVEYYHVEKNTKEKFYKLTDKGNRAFLGHYQFHEEKSKKLHAEIKEYSEGEKEVIVDFLEKYIDHLKNAYE